MSAIAAAYAGAQAAQTQAALSTIIAKQNAQAQAGLLAVIEQAVEAGKQAAASSTAPGTGADADVDFVSRYFAPGAGIDEDPVTGSAHCTLTPFWADQLGKSELRALT